MSCSPYAVVYPRIGSTDVDVSSWGFVILGESHMPVLYLINVIARSLCSELSFLEFHTSNAVNFYPSTSV
jgi:hypothetical protein